MGRYAERTEVGSERSRAEIERTLARYGAEKFYYGWETGVARVGFQMHGRQILFRLVLPDRTDRRFTHTEAKGWERSPAQAAEAYEQAVRQRWRALALVVKAKLEAIEAGITTFDDEFLAATLLPDGGTVGDWMKPQVDEVYRTGAMPPLLPGAGPAPRALPPGKNGA